MTDEHVFPYALGGLLKLKKATCQKHAQITSAIELRCCRKMYKSIRVLNSLPSRRPKLKTLPLTISKNGTNNLIEFPVEGYFGFFPIIHFPLPGILRGRSKNSSDWSGAKYEVLSLEPQDPEIWQNHDADGFTQVLDFDAISLAKMLAKIAHAAAIMQFGFDRFNSWLVPMIESGDERQLSFVVGCNEEIEESNLDLHTLVGRTEAFGFSHLVIYNIRLFAQISKSPTFVVVAGTVSAKDLSDFQFEQNTGIANTIPTP